MTTREGEAAGRRVDAYLNTIERMEPDIAMVDAGAAYASIAISLKRIADSLDRMASASEFGKQTDRVKALIEESLPSTIHDAIYNALMAAELHTRNHR